MGYDAFTGPAARISNTCHFWRQRWHAFNDGALCRKHGQSYETPVDEKFADSFRRQLTNSGK
jgi:hypothetical protein